LTSASIWALIEITRYTIRSSFAGLPHHFSLRTSVITWVVRL
jgi:hypothetical protein